MADQVKSTADLPAEDIKRMHSTWCKALDEGAGPDMDAEVACESFVYFGLAQLEKVIGPRDLSRRLFLMAQFVAKRADDGEGIGPTAH